MMVLEKIQKQKLHEVHATQTGIESDTTQFDNTFGSQHLATHHPCYNEKAHFRISRLHLPVARYCNVLCNFCDKRISQFFHTSRPGLTYEILKPKDALKHTIQLVNSEPKLMVVGIAGPGEPLFNPETFKTLELLSKNVHEMQLCVCTNGLLLPEKMEQLIQSGVSSVTVTLNAVDPLIASRIYHHINYSGKYLKGVKAGETLVHQQLMGIEKAVENGLLVKINSVLIPTINYDHMIDIARTAKELGVYIMNIMPLIPLGNFSAFSPPTCDQLQLARIISETEIPQFRLCRQCRADACGIPGCE